MSYRGNAGVFGIFCLGLAYGIFNEGICAKTVLMSKNVPIPAFDGYRLLSVNLAWTLLIVPWHAFHAILFPVTIVSFFFDGENDGRWLSNRSLIIVCTIFGLLGILMFFNTPGFTAHPVYLPLFAVLIAMLVILSRFLPANPHLRSPSKKASFFPAIAGFLFYFAYVVGLVLLAQARLSSIILFFYAASVLTLFYGILKFRGWFNLSNFTGFALGDYLALSVTSILAGIGKDSVEIIATGMVFAALFASILFYRVKAGDKSSL
jgi:hypothetical protein